MRITRLRLAGFKSFVEPADLVIRDGLTGVVGPNGCGKSNLLEALRWAMGETSARSMRGAGMEDVIFAGTATRPPRDFAEVSILAEVDGRETEVVRRIERGAGSAYRIDGRDVRARDVGLLFADAATGAYSPALVSQNRIGAVIAAKPAERRAMLEEAAGIAGLHVRRREAETRLRQTEANLERLDALLADQSARATVLRRQARAAERYRQLSDRIRGAEARMIFARWRAAAAEAEAAKAAARACTAAVDAAAAAEQVAATAQHRAAAELATARAAALAARDRVTEAAHALAALTGERQAVERRIADLTSATARLAEDRAREGSLASDAAAALARLAAEGEALTAAIAAGDHDAPRRILAVEETERAARDAEVALAQGMSRQAGELAEARVARAAAEAAAIRLARVEREAVQAAASLAALSRPEPLAAQREAAAARRADAMQVAETVRERLAAAEAAERAGIADRDAAETARATARADLAALDSEVAALERATRRSGGERLVDRLAPAPGYERALGAALGDDLESSPEMWMPTPVQPGDPDPAFGTEALADHVAAPLLLARRLRQVLVATEDAGQPLAVGQRLVTRDGTLRRWDGYRASGQGAAAAERLERLNRLTILRAERPPAAAALDRATAMRSQVDAAIEAARLAARTARDALAGAELAMREAGGAEDSAAAALDRLAGQRADGEQRVARIAGDRAEAAAEQAAADRAVAALPDGRAIAAEVESLRQSATLRRTAVMEAQAARQSLDRRLAADRDRLASAQGEARDWRTRAGEAAKRIVAMDRRAAEIAAEAATLADRPAALEQRIATLATAHDGDRAAADQLATAEAAAQAALHAADAAHRQAIDQLGTAREARAAAAARVEAQEQRRVEIGRLSGERFQCPAPVLPERLGFAGVEVGDPAAETRAHERLVQERERIGPVNLVAERELAELDAAGASAAAERAELGQAVARLRGSIATLNREGRQRLRAAFEAVDAHFRRLFATLFDGGAAHLALVDSDDPLEAGLEILAQPPGKRLQSLTLLSGGEQALTAVALIFALFLTNPAPICVLDEVDAPLDDANIDRFCGLLDHMVQDTDTRYLIVTHNAVTMSRMHRLFGVTMVERGVSRLVSVDLQAAETLLAAE